MLPAYREMGYYRGAAAIPAPETKTVRRVASVMSRTCSRAAVWAQAQLRRGKRAGSRAGHGHEGLDSAKRVGFAGFLGRMIRTERIVEHLVGYAERNLLLPQARFPHMGAATRPPGCCEVNAVVHAEICARRASRADIRSPMVPTATSG